MGSQHMTRSGIKHPEALLLAMVITILIITGFQLYWLKDNYGREQKALETRAYSLFRETVRDVQDSIWQKKLQEVLKDTSSARAGLQRKGLDRSIKMGIPRQPSAVRILNLLARQMDDSLKGSKKGKREVYISLNENAKFNDKDSAGKLRFVLDSMNHKAIEEVVVVGYGQSQKNSDSLKLRERASDNRAISISPISEKDSNRKTFSHVNTISVDNEKGDKFRIRIDSLFNDSIPVDHLTTVFAKTLSTQKLNIPFTILRQPEETHHEDDFFRRPPPFDSFLGYKLQLGNAFSYLIKKISLPILFSFFLVGLTVFSFVLLYRSLLRQYRLAQIKNDLISNITHELKTPIATVGVAIEALRNFGAAQSPEKTREYLDISASELQRLGLLVDKVLKISMLENKKIELKKESFNMRELVHEVLNIMKLQFEKHHAQVSVNTAGDNFVIEADRLHITSVIYNLLDNALKYSQDNPVIKVQLSSLPNDIIELKISDNGIGISKEYQAKIFDKFFRVPTGNTHNIKGYGLGLSYVREILMAHMGFISVESEPGKGSSFSVKLPFKEAPVIYFDDKRRIYKKVVKL